MVVVKYNHHHNVVPLGFFFLFSVPLLSFSCLGVAAHRQKEELVLHAADWD